MKSSWRALGTGTPAAAEEAIAERMRAAISQHRFRRLNLCASQLLLNLSSTRVCFGVCFLRAAFVEARATARRCGRERAGERATLRCKVAAIPLVTTRGSSARSATLTEHGATRIPELLRRLRRSGKHTRGSRGPRGGNRRPVVLCRPWGARPPHSRSPQRPARLLPASAAFQAGSRCVEVRFCLRLWGSALERYFQVRGDGRAASRGGSGRRSP
eukprot:COSAG04_NODE_189_length_20957_cov_46.399463_6_plen_215_part_00